MGIKEYVKGIEDIKSVKETKFEVLLNEGSNFIIKRTEKNNESILAFIPSEEQFYIKNMKKDEIYIGDTLTKIRVTRFMKNFDIPLENEWLDINSKYFFEKVFPEIMVNEIYQIAIKNGIKARSFLIDMSKDYASLHTTESEILHGFVDITKKFPMEKIEGIVPKIFYILKKNKNICGTIEDLIKEDKIDFIDKIYELAKKDELIPDLFYINIGMNNVEFFETLLKRKMETYVMKDWCCFGFDEKEYFDIPFSEAIKKVVEQKESDLIKEKIMEEDRNFIKLYENNDLKCELYIKYGFLYISYNEHLYAVITKNMDNIIKEKACRQTIVEAMEMSKNIYVRNYSRYIEFFR